VFLILTGNIQPESKKEFSKKGTFRNSFFRSSFILQIWQLSEIGYLSKIIIVR